MFPKKVFRERVEREGVLGEVVEDPRKLGLYLGKQGKEEKGKEEKKKEKDGEGKEEKKGEEKEEQGKKKEQSMMKKREREEEKRGEGDGPPKKIRKKQQVLGFSQVKYRWGN